MGDIENKIEDSLETEVNNKNVQSDFTKLDEEIKTEEESRKLRKDNIKNFQKSQKPKKSLKKKVLAWALGASIFAGAIVGGVSIYNNNFSESAKYNKDIQTKFEQVDETLKARMGYDTGYGIFHRNQKIQYLRFEDGNGTENLLNVYYEGDIVYNNNGHVENIEGIATFSVLERYYNSLVEAEENNNMLSYLDALNQIFETMEKVKDVYEEKVIWLQNADKESEQKINELFKLDFEKDGLKQTNFLPYNIEVIKWQADSNNKIMYYTFKIHGISYCEKVDIDGKKKIQTYYRDVLVSTSIEYDVVYPEVFDRLKWDLKMYLAGMRTKDDFDIKTTYFQQTDIFENYRKMESGNFNFEKPENAK